MAAPPSSSTRGAPTRSFIYLIVDAGDDMHTLHRIDTSSLFAGRGRARHGAAALPPPLARFECAAGRQFLPLGRGVEKIVSVDQNLHTVIFDTRTEAVRAGPDARHIKWHGHGSTFAEAGGRLYHLGRGPGFDEQKCLDFEALAYDEHRQDWFWSLLPSPPFGGFWNQTVKSFADAASDAIRVSVSDGTYVFDAARASWSKEGDWKMPFHGRAQYVADYGLWFGFTDYDATGLCAVDLNVSGKPKCRHVWDDVDGYANDAGSYLSYLGGGRFCVTRFIQERKDGSRTTKVVVTAVEARFAAASATGGKERPLQMVTRGSVLYQGPVRRSPWEQWAY